MSSAKGQRALSLLEVLLASSLVLLGLALGLQIFLPLGRVARKTSERASLQQEAALVLAWLGRDLASSCPRGLQSNSPYWAIQTRSGLTPEGEERWSPVRILYHWEGGSGRILRAESNTSGETLAPPLSASEFVQSWSLLRARPLARAVFSFSLADQGDGTVQAEIVLGSSRYRLVERRPWMLR